MMVCVGTQLWPILPGPESVWNPVWSPNGDMIAFDCLYLNLDSLLPYIQNPAHEISWFRSNWNDVCLLDISSNELHRLTEDGKAKPAAWDSNGKQLAWINEDTLTIWNADTTSVSEVWFPIQDPWSYELEWSNDNQYLFFQGNGALLDIQQGTIIQPSFGDQVNDAFDLTWSRDGKLLAYFQYDDDFMHPLTVFIENNEGGISTINIKDYGFTSLEIHSWSPNLKILAMSGYRIDDDDMLLLLYTELDEILEFPLMTQTRFDDLEWSPTGKNIGILSGEEIYILTIVEDADSFSEASLDSQKIHLDGPEKAYTVGSISWTPNGNQMAIGIGHCIWVLDLETMAATSLLVNESMGFQNCSKSITVNLEK